MQVLAVLSVPSGSDVPEVTTASVHTSPSDDRQSTVIVTDDDAPDARAAQVHVTVGPETTHDPPVVVLVPGAGALKRLDEALSEMPAASLGPWLVTVSSNVAVPLPALPSVEATCVTPRSATVRTVAQDCAALSAASGSAVV